MYKQFFGLQDNPFNVTPDPRYLYLTPHTQEALACMTYGVQARKGFVLLTGDVGTGKTTLLNKLLEWLREEQIASAFVFNPRLNPFQFLDYALSDFGINCPTRLKSAILAELNNWLLERYKAGTTAVLIVDEAQDASPELLEEIRLLTNLETPSGKLLQIVLSGQQELEMKLRLPEFRQLRQRITLRSKTHPLTLGQTREYLTTRLRVAGSDGREIFAPDAIEALHHYSEGIPRVINILCEDSLVSAFADHQKIVEKEIVEAAARELELDLYPPTAPPPPPLRIDDIIKPGPIPLRAERSQPMPAPAAPRRQAVPRTVAPEPAATVATPMGRIPTQAGSYADAEIPSLAATAPREWATSENPGGGESAEAATRPRPRASAALLPPRPVPVAPEISPADDEILRTLRNREAVAPPQVQPAPPVVRMPPPASRPVVLQPSISTKAKRTTQQNWILWVGLLGAVIAGGVGAIVILKHSPQAEPSARVAAPAPQATPRPQTQPGGPASVPATAPERLTTTAPAAPAPTKAPRAATPVPEPVKNAPPERARKSDEPPPPVRTASRERVRTPAPERTRTVSSPRPTEGSNPAAVPIVGGVVVWANVDGARITIDGRSSADWVTPHEFSRLPVGTHQVVVSKAGYDDVSGQVVIQAGRTAAFNAHLTAAGGEINIITNPPGLSVSIDAGPFRPSPVQASLAVGSHTYRIQLPNSRVYESTFEMRTGAIITRRVDFSAGEWLNPAQ